MSPIDARAHWERVYATTQSDEVSWFQAIPASSLSLLEHARIGPST
jgi:hypothetical protein